MQLKVTVNGTVYDIEVEVAEETRPTLGSIVIGGDHTGQTPAAPASASVTATSANSITAPLAGSVFKVLVEEGQQISAGDVVLVLEAMKMETEITAPSDATVGAVLVAVGDPVQGGQPLIELA